MAGLNLPYQPLRSSLYSAVELTNGFQAADASSFARTTDFLIFRHYVANGRTTPTNYFEGMMRSVHDNAITQAMAEFLAGKKCIAVMGGHKLSRASRDYADVATLSAALTRRGYLVASGGGPGAMEATHLGAAFAHAPAGSLEQAVAEIAQAPSLPGNIGDVVDAQGAPDSSIVAAAHTWFAPTMKLLDALDQPGVSLSVPTWHYGHEPSTAFATHIAKYFQNSIREDGLLAIAKHGVIYAQGKAGTIQEIFQDAAQNYYRSFGVFSPMVFLGETYWTQTYPVMAVLKALLAPSDYEQNVLVTDKIQEAQEFLETHEPA